MHRTRSSSALHRAAVALFVALFVALAAVTATPAQAHVRWSVGIGIGAPGYYGAWGPGWWPAPWYAVPPPVIVAPPPVVQYPYAPWPTYAPPPVEVRPLGPPPPSFWYYCRNPAGYYPNVPDCPEGWTPVPAEPPRAPPHP